LFADAQLWREACFLHHHADLAARFDELRRFAEEAGSACGRLLKSQKQRDGGRFSSAIGAEDGEKFAGSHLQVEAVKGDDIAKFLFYSGEFCEIGGFHSGASCVFLRDHARENAK
jgi:hypothetical protein